MSQIICILATKHDVVASIEDSIAIARGGGSIFTPRNLRHRLKLRPFSAHYSISAKKFEEARTASEAVLASDQ